MDSKNIFKVIEKNYKKIRRQWRSTMGGREWKRYDMTLIFLKCKFEVSVFFGFTGLQGDSSYNLYFLVIVPTMFNILHLLVV